MISNKNFISNSPLQQEKEPKGKRKPLSINQITFLIYIILFGLIIYGIMILLLAKKCHIPPFFDRN